MKHLQIRENSIKNYHTYKKNKKLNKTKNHLCPRKIFQYIKNKK